jgi:hypothetical protein
LAFPPGGDLPENLITDHHHSTLTAWDRLLTTPSLPDDRQSLSLIVPPGTRNGGTLGRKRK